MSYLLKKEEEEEEIMVYRFFIFQRYLSQVIKRWRNKMKYLSSIPLSVSILYEGKRPTAKKKRSRVVRKVPLYSDVELYSPRYNLYSQRYNLYKKVNKKTKHCKKSRTQETFSLGTVRRFGLNLNLNIPDTMSM